MKDSTCVHCKQPIRWASVKDWFVDKDEDNLNDNICEVRAKLTKERNLDHEPMVFNDYIKLVKL